MAAFRMAIGNCCCATVWFDWYWGNIDVLDTPASGYIAMTSAVIPDPPDPNALDEFNSWTDNIDNSMWQIAMTGNYHQAVPLTLVRFSHNDASDTDEEKVFYHRQSFDDGVRWIGHFNGTEELFKWEWPVSSASVWPGAPSEESAYEINYTGVVIPNNGWTTQAVYSASDLVPPIREINTTGGPAPSAWTNDWDNVGLPFVSIVEHPPYESPTDGADPVTFYHGDINLTAVSKDDDNFISFFYLGGNKARWDVVATYDSAGESAEVGSLRNEEIWVQYEFPGLTGIYAEMHVDDLGPILTAANGGETITRIYGVPPRAAPYVFGVKHPRPMVNLNNFSSTLLDTPFSGTRAQVISYTEECKVIAGPYIAPIDPETVPLLGPKDDGADSIVVWQGTYTADRIQKNQLSEDPDYPGWGIIFPYALNAMVQWGDINERKDWGCIFSTSERTINVQMDNEFAEFWDGWYENILTEDVTLRIRLGEAGAAGSGDIKTWECFRNADLEAATSLVLAPELDPSQGLSGRHAAWIERVYTTEPTSSVEGEWGSHKLILHRIGSDEVWAYEDDGTGTNPSAPRIYWVSDSFMYVRNFRHQWTEAEGAVGDAINTYFTEWLFSYKWDSANSRPKYMYPMRSTTLAEIFNSNFNNDSYKVYRKNRIAPPPTIIRHP